MSILTSIASPDESGWISRARALQRNFRWIVVRYERFAENLADSGGYDDLTTDAALSVFISAIVRHDPRVSHLYLDISAVAGLGDWKRRSNSSRSGFSTNRQCSAPG